MSTKKIVLQLTQGQREHMKMITGLGPARLTIELGPKLETPFGKPWSTKMASKALQLNADQRIVVKEATGENFEYIVISKASVDKWMRG
ncbi:MAG: hypothetical protein ACFFEF_06535 [Candidatus Thorarchaeota archaeon]